MDSIELTNEMLLLLPIVQFASAYLHNSILHATQFDYISDTQGIAMTTQTIVPNREIYVWVNGS